jgi:DNA-directed RNA polymerase specialized sigma24 family protein
VSPEERDAFVTELLDDAIMRLVAPGARMPRVLAAYLVTALRRRVYNARRSALRRVRVVREASPLAENVELDASALTSEATRRASAGPDAEPLVISPALARLIERLVRQTTPVERRLLDWSANHVPQREMAAWLGIGYEATGKRVRRLRARLAVAARAYLISLEPAERAELERIIARAAEGLSARDLAPVAAHSPGAEHE